jgi:transcriptional regulator with XRE-family HTH domain
MDAKDELRHKIKARLQLPSPAVRRALREEAGLSQAELAKALGVHRETISRWEAGKRGLRGRYLVEYAALLKELQHDMSGRNGVR